MKFLVLILRNMRRQARRSILTILTIAIPTLVFAMLVSVPTSMDRIVDRVSKNQRLFVINRAGPWDIPAKYCVDIKKLAHVKGCAADLDEFMLYRNLPPPDERGVKNHVCLVVPDVQKAVAQLEARPARKLYSQKIEVKVGVNRKRQANLFDPDGTRIELMEADTVDGKPTPPSTAPPPQ